MDSEVNVRERREKKLFNLGSGAERVRWLVSLQVHPLCRAMSGHVNKLDYVIGHVVCISWLRMSS